MPTALSDSGPADHPRPVATCSCEVAQPVLLPLGLIRQIASGLMQPQGGNGELALARLIATPHLVANERNLTLEVFRALADPVRLELLAHVAAHGPICVCHLEERLGYTQSRVSKHLGTLRRAGLVRSRRDGTWVYYELDDNALELAGSFLSDVRSSAGVPHETELCAQPQPKK
jgi:ArsR family transcriptional regulator, arsenate/arsenite/antimonite-responsive transcriptional repressor